MWADSDICQCAGGGGGGGGDGSFFLACEDLGGRFDDSFPACAFFFFFKWRSALAHQFHFLGQDQSTVAQRAETTVAECSLTSCVGARFPDRFPHYSHPTPTSLGQGCTRA